MLHIHRGHSAIAGEVNTQVRNGHHPSESASVHRERTVVEAWIISTVVALMSEARSP